MLRGRGHGETADRATEVYGQIDAADGLSLVLHWYYTLWIGGGLSSRGSITDAFTFDIGVAVADNKERPRLSVCVNDVFKACTSMAAALHHSCNRLVTHLGQCILSPREGTLKLRFSAGAHATYLFVDCPKQLLLVLHQCGHCC